MADPSKQLPQGIRLSIDVYMVVPTADDGDDIKCKITLGGRKDYDLDGTDWQPLVDNAIVLVNNATEHTDARLMTDDEIRDYAAEKDGDILVSEDGTAAHGSVAGGA